MRQKLFLTLLALLTLSGSRAWAFPVKVTLVDGTNAPYDTYGTRSTTSTPNTLTSKATSGLAGVVLTAPVIDQSKGWWSTYCLALKTSAVGTDETMTIAAPSGYVIKGYSITMQAVSSDYPYTVTIGSNAQNITGSSAYTFSAQEVFTSSLSCTLRCTHASTVGNWLAVKSLTLDVCPEVEATPVSATSSLATDKAYNITCPRGWWDVASGTSVVNSTVETGLAKSFSDTKQQFAFIQHDRKYYLYSVSEGKFAYVDGTKLSLTQYFTSDVASSNVTFTASTSSTYATSYPVVVTVGGKHFGISIGYSPDIYQYTNAADEGNAAAIYPAASFDPTTAQAQITNTVNNITYSVMLDGSQVASTAVAYCFSTDAPSLPASAASNGYCTYKYYSDAACTSEITQIGNNVTIYAKVELTTDLPFEFASAIDDANAKWYTLKLRDSYPYNNDGTFALSNSEVVTNDGQWVFTGNVYAAQVYNKGAAKYLVWNGSALAFSETATTSWLIKPHGAGFILYEPTNYYFPFANSSGTLAYSNSDSGNFSESGNSARFIPTEVEDDYSASIVANVQPYFTSGVGSYFGLKQTVYDTYNSRVTTAATSCNATEYGELLDVVNNAANYVYPETGYYRIKSYSASTYLGKTSSAAVGFGQTDAASVIYLTRSGDEGSYTYTIAMQGANYRSVVDQATGNYTFAVAEANPGKFTMNDLSSNTVFGFTYVTGTALATNSLANAGTAAYWTLEDATSFTGTLTDANDNTGAGHSYATLCVPFAISGLTGASAYAPTLSDNMLNLGSGASTVVAGTPVILVGASEAGSYTATINTGSAPVTAVATTNDLSGTFTGTSLDCTATTGTNYVLGFDEENDNRIGFYHVANSEFPLSANRAYLVTGGGGSVKGFTFTFDDDATAIEMVNGQYSMVNGPAYNLAGQRISKMQKGINIVNGKKILK